MNIHNQGPAFPRTRYKYDGQGGYAPNSGKIPLLDAVLYVGGVALTVWGTLAFARWIWG